ncbi:MAG: helix-turn-helix transcriptional regulator [Ruminococcus sp.]|nr:helix-turn-helix transcriptional regulator [Ruminococcus sp.]
MYDNLQQKLTVRSTAKYLGLDPTYLSKLFVKEVGKGFRQFIIDTKISTAKNMIMNNKISFSEISLALGFSSQSAFISAFKKNTGTTPGEFRKLHHNI